MIRLTYLLRRQPAMSRADFQKYWREVHGPLVAGCGHIFNILRYVQGHTLEDGQIDTTSGPRGKMEQPYDGVEEFWWMKREDLVSALNSDRGKTAFRHLVEDEAKFIEHPNSPLWFAHEYPQINPSPENMVATERSPLLKLYFPIRHLPQFSMEEVQLHWRTMHGPLIRLSDQTGLLKRYIQVHRYEDEMEDVMRSARHTTVEPYDGHAEIWQERDPGKMTPERKRFYKTAAEDESRFTDFSRSSMWLAKEWVFIDHR